MFLSYVLPVTIVPILTCAGIMWYLKGIPNYWSVIWRGALIVPIAYLIISQIPFFQSSFYETVDGYGVCKAFFEAAIPEEICKLATLYYIAWRVYKWQFNKFSDTLLCSVIIATAFSLFENIGYSDYRLIWRIVSFFGHLSYAVIMGYCFSLLYYTKIQEKRWLTYLAMLGLPVLFHGLWDANGFGLLSSTKGFLGGLVLLAAIGLPILLLYAVYKLLSNAKKYDEENKVNNINQYL